VRAAAISFTILRVLAAAMADRDRWISLGKQVQQKLAILEDVEVMVSLSPKEEIQMRAMVVEVLFNKYEAQRIHSDLYAAIEHGEALLRLLSSSSRDRLELLHRLSYMKLSVSISMVTGSLQAVKESIAYAREAKKNAEPGQDSMLYQIYGDLGHGLSTKAQLDNDSSALDEAIICGREAVRLAPDRRAKTANATNLAVRLHRRYRLFHKEVDGTEALSILAECLEALPAGSPEHGGALLARGEICYEIFKHSGSTEDLDEAITHCEQGFSALPEQDERRVNALGWLSRLHDCKHKVTNDPADMHQALKYQGIILESTPAGHPLRVQFVTQILLLLKTLVSSVDSVPYVEDAIKKAYRFYVEIPVGHANRYTGGETVGHLLARRYIISRRLVDLKVVANHVLVFGREKNDDNIRRWSRIVDLSPVLALSSCLDNLGKGRYDDTTKKHALDRIYNYFQSAYESAGPINGIINVYKEHSQELNDICTRQQSTNLNPGETRSQDPNNGMEKVQIRKDGHQLGRQNYLNPLTGGRYLATQRGSGTMILSMEGVMRSVYGLEEDDPMSLPWPDFLAREARLERQTQEKEQAEGRHPNHKLCRVCRNLKPLVPGGNRAFSWNTGLLLPYGTWAQLYGRTQYSACSVCRLLISLISVNGQRDLHSRLARMDHEIQGVQFHIQKLATGENMLGVEYGLKSVGALRIVTPQNRNDALRQGYEIVRISEGLSSSIHGQSQGQLVNLQNARTWLDNCDEKHGRLCSAFWSNERCAGHIQMLLIDVTAGCLIKGTSADRYFALSYVWGCSNMSTTLKSNFDERLEQGSLLEAKCKLPQTIRDAMVVVASLGERYLWVDSLCIVQDDADHKYRDIRNMDIVYGRAFATIAAVHGADADAGLPGVRPNTRPPQITESLTVLAGSSELEYNSARGSESVEVTMAATASPLPLILDTEVWGSRGWTLQEKLLSRRCLYFTPTLLYFQCNHETVGETTLGAPATYLGHSLGSSRSFQSENPLADLNRVALISGSERLCRNFKVYAKLVELYNIRQLSDGFDILNAFSGILSVLGERFRSGFVSGLPTFALDLSLLWTPEQKMLQRPYKPGQYFPSWSWAGWKGFAVPTSSVEYRLFDTLNSESLPNSLVDSFCIHHHGVLRTIKGRGSSVMLGSTAAMATGSFKGTTLRPDDNSVLDTDFAQTGVLGPDFGPEVLQFWAETVQPEAFHFAKHETAENLSSRDNIHTPGRQAVLRLRDLRNRHCGLWHDNKNHRLWWASERQKQPPMELVAISRLSEGSTEGPYRVEGEVNIFDENFFPPTGPGSGIVYVLVIEWHREIATRVTVAQVHARAWDRARPKRKHIRLI
jgi:tetratricopeptide (TPR) repeat protein